ncbi:MAG: hypothetical protein AB7P20_12435 [Rhizobiaceae bacterium]
MNHLASPCFWEAYYALPDRVRRLADRNYALLKRDPTHPSLQFKPVGRYWAVRVGLRYRALAVRDGDDLIWFWIGSHAEYDALIRR